MKTNFKTIGLLLFAITTLVSCDNSDNSDGDNNVILPPTSAAFKSISEKGLKRNTQNFTITAASGVVTFTSAKGVKVSINGDCLTKNGTPVTGTVDIEYIELFDKGNMLVTNKPPWDLQQTERKTY
jgi:hypothetical protein